MVNQSEERHSFTATQAGWINRNRPEDEDIQGLDPDEDEALDDEEFEDEEEEQDEEEEEEEEALGGRDLTSEVGSEGGGPGEIKDRDRERRPSQGTEAGETVSVGRPVSRQPS
jgi:hypothetical protein